MKAITLVQTEHWLDQSVAESIAWHEGLRHFKNDTEREAYKAGFMSGWRDMRKHIMLHGLVIDPPAKREDA